MFNYYSSPWLVKYIALHTLNYYSVIITNPIVPPIVSGGERFETWAERCVA